MEKAQEAEDESWVVALPEAALEADAMQPVLIGGKDIAIYRVGNCLYATDNLCTHGQARLTDGWFEDGVIECPLHGGRFVVATGEGLGPPIYQDIVCHAVRVRDGRIEIALAAEPR